MGTLGPPIPRYVHRQNERISEGLRRIRENDSSLQRIDFPFGRNIYLQPQDAYDFLQALEHNTTLRECLLCSHTLNQAKNYSFASVASSNNNRLRHVNHFLRNNKNLVSCDNKTKCMSHI